MGLNLKGKVTVFVIYCFFLLYFGMIFRVQGQDCICEEKDYYPQGQTIDLEKEEMQYEADKLELEKQVDEFLKVGE